MKAKWLNGIMGLIIFAPILLMGVWAVTARWPWPDLWPESFSLRGLQEIWRQGGRLGHSIFTSILVSLVTAFLATAFSLASARALLDASGFLTRLIRMTLSLPFLIPVTVLATGIHQKMIQWGLSNSVTGIILVHLIYSLPYSAYLIHDAYQAIGVRLEEQAWLLGANRWQAFMKVSLPQLIPVLFTSFSMAYIVSFSQYFLTLMIGGGQVQTLSILIFPYLQANDRTIASNYSLLFLMITLVVLAVFQLAIKIYQRHYQTVKYY